MQRGRTGDWELSITWNKKYWVLCNEQWWMSEERQIEMRQEVIDGCWLKMGGQRLLVVVVRLGAGAAGCYTVLGAARIDWTGL